MLIHNSNIVEMLASKNVIPKTISLIIDTIPPEVGGW